MTTPKKANVENVALNNSQIVSTGIIVVQPTMRSVQVLSVKKVVREGFEPFIAIIAKDGSERISVSCSMNAYEKMGIAEVLPLKTSYHNTTAELYISYIPEDGNTYGYMDRISKVVVAYANTGRYQLANVDSVVDSSAIEQDRLQSDFEMFFGKPFDAATATDAERDMLLRLKFGK